MRFKGFVTAILLAIFVGGISANVVKAKGGNDEDQVQTTCANRVVTTTRIVSIEDRNAFLVSAMEQFQTKQAQRNQVATPQEEADFIETVAKNAPVEVVTTAVFSDDLSLLPPAEVDPSDGKPKRFKNPDRFDRFAEKVRKAKCQTNSPTTTELTAASSMSVATAWSPTWYYCTAQAYAKNITGQTMIRLVQRQDWLLSIYGTIQDWDPVDVETYAFLNWKTSGSYTTVGPRWLTSPWQLYASTKQKFILDYKVYTIQTKYLSTSLTVGPGSQCIMSPAKGPGM